MVRIGLGTREQLQEQGKGTAFTFLGAEVKGYYDLFTSLYQQTTRLDMMAEETDVFDEGQKSEGPNDSAYPANDILLAGGRTGRVPNRAQDVERAGTYIGVDDAQAREGEEDELTARNLESSALRCIGRGGAIMFVELSDGFAFGKIESGFGRCVVVDSRGGRR